MASELGGRTAATSRTNPKSSVADQAPVGYEAACAKPACRPVGAFRDARVGLGTGHLDHQGVGARARPPRSTGLRAVALARATASAALPRGLRSRRVCGLRMWKGSSRPSCREMALPPGRRGRDRPGPGRGRSQQPGGRGDTSTAAGTSRSWSPTQRHSGCPTISRSATSTRPLRVNLFRRPCEASSSRSTASRGVSG
jgi:hypothetical protein